MCPICDSANITPSKRRKLRDLLYAFFGQVAYRCRDCKSRFHIASRLEEEASRRREWLLSVRSAEEKTLS
jgi:transposase-like protein